MTSLSARARSSRSRYRTLAGLLSVVAVTVCLGCSEIPEPSSEKPSPVRVQTVRRDQVAVEITLVGTVVPADVSRVASGAAGRVLEFPHREGALVKKGQVLARLRTTTLKIEIEGAKALLREKQQRYEELNTGYRPEEIAQAEAKMKGAESLFEFAKSQRERLKGLREDRAVTSDVLDKAISDADQAEQALVEAHADYKLKTDGFRPEQIAQAKAALDAQHQEVLRLEDELTKRTVAAPFTGHLVEKHTDIGEWVEVGGPVATLVNLNEAEVIVNVEEQYVGMLRPDTHVEIRFSFLPPNERVFVATIDEVVPRSNWQNGSRSFPLRLRIKNRMTDGQPVLKEGMLGSVTLRGPERQAILVHKDSVVRRNGELSVFVVADGNRVEPVSIREGIHTGEYIEALDAELVSDQLIVTEGAERLRAFEQVAIQNEALADDAKNSLEPSTETGD